MAARRRGPVAGAVTGRGREVVVVPQPISDQQQGEAPAARPGLYAVDTPANTASLTKNKRVAKNSSKLRNSS